ncbi:zinc finger protein [Gigaspora margarita]|uniref:Zinc finger protein n=1 Tax=Gigaspora margarita TaxID=4874 RepID=A0A8H4ACL6_GIGMA|nr:zinc finger protein [Gigaspora margarita]
MKRHFFVETNFSEKDISDNDEQNQVEPVILSSEKPKRNKIRTSPDPKWMDNGNDAWLEYRNVDGTIFMFCRWCESKNYANELAKGTTEAEAKKNQKISAIKFSIQLATDAQKLKTISQMQCIYFAAKKYLALAIYPDLYQFVDF